MSKDKTNLEHALRVFEAELGFKPDPTNEKDKATVGILEIGIRYALAGNLIAESELASFHDALYNATDKSYDNDTLYRLWLRVPNDIKADAKHWGVSDTVVRDHVYEWAIQNPELFNGIDSKKEVD